MKIQHISVDGQQVRVAVRAGADDGVPLLLVNGIGASLEVLQPFTDALDPALTVIRFDVPGTGGSPLPQRPYRFGGLCKLIAALLSQLGHETADVLGISWGGGVAQHFAAFQPRRCRRQRPSHAPAHPRLAPARFQRRPSRAGHRGRAAGAGGRAVPAPGGCPRRAAASFPALARHLKPR